MSVGGAERKFAGIKSSTEKLTIVFLLLFMLTEGQWHFSGFSR